MGEGDAGNRRRGAGEASVKYDQRMGWNMQSMTQLGTGDMGLACHGRTVCEKFVWSSGWSGLLDRARH